MAISATRVLGVGGRRVPLPAGVAALVGAATIWGATLVITKSVLADVGPFTLLLLRFIAAFIALAPWAYRHGYRLRLSLHPAFIAFGFTGMVLHLGLETVGLRYTSAASAALIVAAIPAVTAALSYVFLREKLSGARLLGVALSVAGVVFVTQARVTGGGPSELVGNILVLAAVVAWGVFTIQGKKLSRRHSSLVATTAAVGAAVALLAPAAGAELWLGDAPRFTLEAVLGITYLGVLASALAFWLWNHALHHVDASVAAPYVNLVPVIGLALAIAVGEPTSGAQLLGGAVVAVGVWLSTTARRPSFDHQPLDTHARVR